METILLVDRTNRDQCPLTAFLTARGYTVLHAGDTDAARAALAQTADIVVGDLQLLGGHVAELLSLARQRAPETPVLLLADHDVPSAIAALKQGAFAYLAAPVNLEELLVAIQRAAERVQLQREVLRLRQQVQPARDRDTTPCYRAGMKLEDLEREVIQHCLLHTGGSRQHTAELLGISTRTLLRKIHEYHLEDPLRQAKVNGNAKRVRLGAVGDC